MELPPSEWRWSVSGLFLEVVDPEIRMAPCRERAVPAVSEWNIDVVKRGQAFFL